jgi:hypothetical protein
MTGNVKIRLTVKGTELTATLVGNETTRDFVALLPLTLTMGDLFRRERFANLPRAISQGGKRTHAYEVPYIAYWPPGLDVAIIYGRCCFGAIPSPGSSGGPGTRPPASGRPRVSPQGRGSKAEAYFAASSSMVRRPSIRGRPREQLRRFSESRNSRPARLVYMDGTNTGNRRQSPWAAI